MSKLKYYDGTNWKIVNGQVTGDTLPIGAIVPYCSTTAPANWLVCDGSYVSKETYADLYNIIGDDYLDGGTAPTGTFRLPNFKGRVPVGYNSGETEFDAMGETGGEKKHQLTYDELPSQIVTGYCASDKKAWSTGSWGDNSSTAYPTNVIANSGHGTGEQPHNNLQPYQVVCYIIKAKQSAGLIANVSNIQSESTTDTYSCDYANNTFQNKPTILFTGNTTGQVLLSQSAANFTYLEIFYQGADNFNSTKLYNPNGKSAYLITGWMANNTGGNVKLARVSISGTTISKTNYTSLNYDSNYANASEENGISITTVIGYK